MFAPEVEARFKRIEDAHAATAELLHRFEQETRERLRHAEAVQDSVVKWMAQSENKMNALIDAHVRLAETVERFLNARTNGGAS